MRWLCTPPARSVVGAPADWHPSNPDGPEIPLATVRVTVLLSPTEKGGRALSDRPRRQKAMVLAAAGCAVVGLVWNVPARAAEPGVRPDPAPLPAPDPTPQPAPAQT